MKLHIDSVCWCVCMYSDGVIHRYAAPGISVVIAVQFCQRATLTGLERIHMYGDLSNISLYGYTTELLTIKDFSAVKGEEWVHYIGESTVISGHICEALCMQWNN